MEMKMENVGDELANIIGALREDGVKKGKEEAEGIVSAAKKDAAGILDEARTEAEDITKEARQKAQTIHERLETQLDLALRDFLLKAKGELEDMLALEPLRKACDKAMSDPEFIKKLIYEMLTSYAKSEASHGSRHIYITVPENMKEQFVKEWIVMMRDELNAAVTLHAKGGLLGFELSSDMGGGTHITDSASIVEALRPFISERFQYMLDKKAVPKD